MARRGYTYGFKAPAISWRQQEEIDRKVRQARKETEALFEKHYGKEGDMQDDFDAFCDVEDNDQGFSDLENNDFRKTAPVPDAAMKQARKEQSAYRELSTTTKQEIKYREDWVTEGMSSLQVLEYLEGVCVARGYRQGYVAYKYKEIFGHWPNKDSVGAYIPRGEDKVVPDSYFRNPTVNERAEKMTSEQVLAHIRDIDKADQLFWACWRLFKDRAWWTDLTAEHFSVHFEKRDDEVPF